MVEELKTCLRPGCKKQYKESENVEGSCHYHSGNPIFHDIKKGWTCCNQIVYDWDEFEKIPGCCSGKHCDKKEEIEFYKSNTVANAQKAIDKEEKVVKIKSIEDYNREVEAKAKASEAKKVPADKKPVIKDGKYLCANMGCNQYFDEASNNDEACKYHLGQPYFHDGKKSWTCCKGEALDWDEFLKIPPCKIGRHTIKYQ